MVAADDRGNALGNLNVESYDTFSLRKDLFINYGPYGLPALLLKVAPPHELLLTAYDNEQIKISSAAHESNRGCLLPHPERRQLGLRR